jgi:Concanavalin A-like lectin/glucanases superfamily
MTQKANLGAGGEDSVSGARWHNFIWPALGIVGGVANVVTNRGHLQATGACRSLVLVLVLVLGLGLGLVLPVGGCVRVTRDAPACANQEASVGRDAGPAETAPHDSVGDPLDLAATLDGGDALPPPMDGPTKNYYLRFNALGDYVRLDQAMAWASSFTVAVKIRLAALPAANKDFLTCFSYDAPTNTLSGWELGFKDAGKPRWWIVNHDKDPYPKLCEKNSTSGLKIGTWYLLTFVFDYTSSTTATFKLYVNGAVWVDKGSPGSSAATCQGTMAPGPFEPDLFRLGGMDAVKLDVDDLRIFDRDLSATEVASLGGGALPPGLVLRWDMNEGVGSTLTDGSGKGRTGTILNPDWQIH